MKNGQYSNWIHSLSKILDANLNSLLTQHQSSVNAGTSGGYNTLAARGQGGPPMLSVEGNKIKGKRRMNEKE